MPDSDAPSRCLPYKTVGDLTLNLHLFSPSSPSNVPAPVVVWFHGGGWQGGTPEQFYPQSRALAEKGILCLSVEYRLSKLHGTTPFEAIQDAFDAMRFIRAHAADWGGDPGKIAAGGGSAGAHLACATACLTAEDLAGPPKLAEQARPDLLLLYNPVYNNGPDNGYGHDRLGGRWREASPAHQLHAGMPPMLVMLGDEDDLIPVSVAEEVQRQLDDLKVPNRLIIYSGATHGFFNRNNHLGVFYSQTLSEVEQFLQEYGWVTS
jgi:acetyl esterase/lipase